MNHDAIDNLEIIKGCSTIVDVSRVILDDALKKEIQEIYGDQTLIRCIENSKAINAYKIIYRSQGHNVVGFFIEPKNTETSNLLPCIIYNRGGSGDFGLIRNADLFLDRMGINQLVQKGFLIIATQYSGNDGGEGKDEMGGEDLEDVLNLHIILDEIPFVNKNKIGMMGRSRGGMMTYMALSKVDWIKAAVSIAGPTDLIHEIDFRPEMQEHYKMLFGGSAEEKKKRSALYWADKINKNAPILILHGSSDWRVNPLDSLKLAEKLYEQHASFRLVFFEGADHQLTEFKDESKQMVIEWFEKYLKENAPLPNTNPHGK